MSKELGSEVQGDWSDFAKAVEAPSATGTPSSASLLPDTVEQMQDPIYQAKKLGFAGGAFVVEKNAHALCVWKIMDIQPDRRVTLLKQEEGRDTDRQEVDIEALLSAWRLHKGKVTTALKGWSFEGNPCSPMTSPSWHNEMAKGAIAIAMHEVFGQYQEMNKKIELLQNPSQVMAKEAVAKGDLVLVAASQRVERQKAAGGSALPVLRCALPGGEIATFAASPHYVPPFSPAGEPNKAAWVAPFWSVTGADSAKTANMQLSYHEVPVGNLHVGVPLLINCKPLAAGSMLSWHKATKVELPGHSQKEEPTAAKQETGNKRKRA